jgi:broad specificity phosphatase PhoE
MDSAMAVSGANGAAGPRSTRTQKLFVMRHGQRWDDANRDWIHEPGVRTWDPPLTEDGVGQARSAGEKLRSEGVIISRILVSPFLRCVQTAAGVIEGMYPQGSDMANLKVSAPMPNFKSSCN